MASLAAYLVATLFLSLMITAHGAIGMNWGRQTAQRLVPSVVIDLLLQNGVTKARVFTAQEDVMQAISGAGIDLTIGIINVDLVNTETLSQNWVQRVLPYFDPAKIRQVYIGDYVYEKKQGSGEATSDPVFEANLQVMKLVQDTLNKAGKYDVKTNIPLPFDILKDNITNPSDAEIRDDIKPYFSQLLDHLVAKKAPLTVTLFPIIYVIEHNIDLDFAFVGESRHFVADKANGLVYRNAFEFMYDSFVWALEKAGAPYEMEIVVAGIGWPTDGYPGADSLTAERFFKCFLPFIESKKGTPKRPGQWIDVYLHSLTDEPLNTVDQPYMRHWGIYRSNGEPKYKIDLSGLGRDVFPSQGRGIQRMPTRWCVYTGEARSVEEVQKQVDVACKSADCTAMEPGGSCSELNYAKKVSYSFNMYFQASFQNETMCDFEGLGEVVPKDPSVGSCVFPVEVVKGRQNNTPRLYKSSGNRRWQTAGSCAMQFVILASVVLEYYSVGIHPCFLG